MDTAQQAVARSFVDLRNHHAGATILVCGCGESLTRLTNGEGIITIGVNDVGRWFTPDYLVVLNTRRQFTADRYAWIEASRAGTLVTQLDPSGFAHPNVVQFRLGRRGGTELSDDDTLAYSNTSPYVAIQLARHLGARRIGLLGVDFGDRHFFGQTGPHAQAGQLSRIDAEYGALALACQADGVELVNLSPVSRLRSVPRADLMTWMHTAPSRAAPRVFFVHYRFLSCGTVFDTGLREAADSLGIPAAHADWDAPDLDTQIAAFQPDLLFVVHGRRFVKRWGKRFDGLRSAVWLVDEPYEVDDTARWSGHFDVVFVNDPATVSRHRNAHGLEVAYAPVLHHPGSAQGGAGVRARSHGVGFIGGGNPARERMLGALADHGLLDYVVGGPWRDPRVAARCLAANVSPADAAALYRDTRIVINVFRDRHHYNRDALPGLAANPRIFEALACGAAVVSEPRPGLHALLPELPTFDSEAQAIAVIGRLLADDAARLRVQQACAARIRQSRYQDRLAAALAIAVGWPAAHAAPDAPSRPDAGMDAPHDLALRTDTRHNPAPRSFASDRIAPPIPQRGVMTVDADWDGTGPVVQATGDGVFVIDPGPQRGPALERGLVSRLRFDDVDLTFEARLTPGACLLAKVHQQHRIDQSTDSYHLLISARRAYLARHDHVFTHVGPPGHGWVAWRLTAANGVLTVYRDGTLLHRVRDTAMHGGYAFLGAMGGAVHLRGIQLKRTDPLPVRRSAQALLPIRARRPRLSIVTTVYDRVDCLRRCIASVQNLDFDDFEHLIVADHPPADVVADIHQIVDEINDPRVGFYNLAQRHNDWGIAPAAAGLQRARGDYLAFLSDDNGYTPDHFDPLIHALQRDPALGFVYCSCRYDGRLVLNHPVPRPGRIDLGQPLFRRELFDVHLNNDLPFDMMAWDWHLVDMLMRRGVRWKHVDRPSFLFRLAQYPELWAS